MPSGRRRSPVPLPPPLRRTQTPRAYEALWRTPSNKSCGGISRTCTSHRHTSHNGSTVIGFAIWPQAVQTTFALTSKHQQASSSSPKQKLG